MIRRVSTVLAIVILTLNLNLHGDSRPTKSLSLWQLYHYKYTSLLRQSPLCYEPYKAYVLVDKYVTIENKNNKNVISITADIPKLLKADVTYNKAHAKKYKGSTKQKVRNILVMRTRLMTSSALFFMIRRGFQSTATNSTTHSRSGIYLQSSKRS